MYKNVVDAFEHSLKSRSGLENLMAWREFQDKV